MEGTWHLRDIIDYQEIAWESLLYQAATKRHDMCGTSIRSIGTTSTAPRPMHSWFRFYKTIPGCQENVETLALGEVEIERASDAFTADGKQYRAGTYVIGMHQPYSGWAKRCSKGRIIRICASILAVRPSVPTMSRAGPCPC